MSVFPEFLASVGIPPLSSPLVALRFGIFSCLLVGIIFAGIGDVSRWGKEIPSPGMLWKINSDMRIQPSGPSLISLFTRSLLNYKLFFYGR